MTTEPPSCAGGPQSERLMKFIGLRPLMILLKVSRATGCTAHICVGHNGRHSHLPRTDAAHAPASSQVESHRRIETLRLFPKQCAKWIGLRIGSFDEGVDMCDYSLGGLPNRLATEGRSEEHTSELQSHVNLVC